ncbi:hypothetical protein ACFVTM_17215 [Arthrobacter sp. NPDC058130]|uniref:hypothetical protein n=1 Tax=Arthrobacter sp. NPDC058130 TaxID=3346353 RepID=UPI0036EA0E50
MHPEPYAVIHFFDVSENHRRRGYRANGVQLPADRNAGTPLVAFSVSEDSDKFWGSRSRDRHEHTAQPKDYQRMFVGGS